MTTLTATEAATTARVNVRTVRAWCRTGQLAAVKRSGRWVVAPSALARLLCPATDCLERGVAVRQLTGRALRRAESRRLARATSRTYRTPLYGQHQRARIALANAGHTTARDYLFDLGLDVEDIEQYEAAFGRKVAEVYRQQHHAEPDTRGLVILHGRLQRVARYTDITDLRRGARAYARTADMFGLVA